MDIVNLRRISVKTGIPQAIIEKDYVLSVILNEISKTPVKNSIIFKGGTAIKKIYFEEARFSEDLDFTVLNLEKMQIIQELGSLFKNKEIEGISFGEIKEEKTSAGLKLSLKYSSVLNHPQRIKFDFSFRANLILNPVENQIIDSYRLGNNTIKVLCLEELFAEKMHAIMSRVVPRDLYDVWFLLGKKAKVDSAIVQKKFAYYNEHFELQKLKLKIDDFKIKWHQDLRQLLSNVPEFGVVSKEVLDGLENLGIE